MLILYLRTGNQEGLLGTTDDPVMGRRGARPTQRPPGAKATPATVCLVFQVTGGLFWELKSLLETDSHGCSVPSTTLISTNGSSVTTHLSEVSRLLVMHQRNGANFHDLFCSLKEY